ncbi:MAG: hypothetical protein HY925_02515 [Elusimicrobia bacterium]|nr:hypothetical protein [Elusimicrobiota bacterium]
MKRLLLPLPLLLSSILALAHDGGHGYIPDENRLYMPDRSPRQGGVLARVVLASDAVKGSEAPLIYNAELVRGEDGDVKIYLYDADVATLRLETLSAKAKGSLRTVKKGKVKNVPFELSLDKSIWAYVGKAPKASRKPYAIEVSFGDGRRELSGSFEALD